MAPSPLRAPAAPVQDAPRKISTPVQSNAAARKPEAAPQNARTRPTNPALLSRQGESGFDGRLRQGGGPQLNPQGTDPLAGAPVRGGLAADAGVSAAGGGVQAAASTQAVGGMDDKGLDALFTKASKTFESILSSLGYSNLPEIEDPTERLNQRSVYLGGLLDADPTLKEKIAPSDLAQVAAMSNIFLKLQPQLEGPRLDAVNAYLSASMRMYAEWPPPPGGNN